MPNGPVFERRPSRRAIPGSTEQQELGYTRHGTVCILLFLVVHTGDMEAVRPEANDSEHDIRALEDFRRGHRNLRGIFLGQADGASHIAGTTAEFFSACRSRWRPRFTPRGQIKGGCSITPSEADP
jgi:hypothetical protein